PNRFPLGQSAQTFRLSTLEEELQFIQGLNHSTGRVAGIYPEIKQPAWHRKQGHDISRIVLPILAKYGYQTKQDDCWIQCFEFEETQRIRTELGWQGRLVQLLGGGKKDEPLMTPEGLAEIAKVADGIGPSIGSVVTGKTVADRHVTSLVKDAHAVHLVVHPYTLRIDELPKCVTSPEELMHALFDEASVDGLFSDFPDVLVKWLHRAR
ncbi:MAG: glycerophosphodiester phosphodiesterase, partial [Verrucomicrobiaceae bacterium]|nr:glycerophosphodiester phosphodiesterase [Verrucomicrobiaceae bacterium]